jgi:fatty acid desaturase
MKPEELFERREFADRLEAVLVLATVIGIAAAILSLFLYGWPTWLILLFLSLIAFALSRLFDLLSELLAEIGRGKNQFSPPPKDEKNP